VLARPLPRAVIAPRSPSRLTCHLEDARGGRPSALLLHRAPLGVAGTPVPRCVAHKSSKGHTGVLRDVSLKVRVVQKTLSACARGRAAGPICERIPAQAVVAQNAWACSAGTAQCSGAEKAHVTHLAIQARQRVLAAILDMLFPRPPRRPFALCAGCRSSQSIRAHVSATSSPRCPAPAAGGAAQ
jgi:hypothetical protein